MDNFKDIIYFKERDKRTLVVDHEESTTLEALIEKWCHYFPTLISKSPQLLKMLQPILSASVELPMQKINGLRRLIGMRAENKRVEVFLEPYMLSDGTFQMKEGYRCKHYIPAPFTIHHASDRVKVIREIENRMELEREEDPSLPSETKPNQGIEPLQESKSNNSSSLFHPPLHQHNGKFMDFCLLKKWYDLVKAIKNCATFTTPEAKIAYFSEKLMDAAEDDDYELCQFLVDECGADVNSMDCEWSPLYSACTCGSYDICLFLIQKGAFVDFNEARSLLFVAATRGFLSISQLLLENGADINIENKEDGQFPIMAAVSKGHVQVLEFLYKSGANIDCLNSSGQSLLHLAVLKSKMDCLNYLLKQGINMEAVDREGRTALHLAASCGKLEICRKMVESGCKLDCKDLMDLTPAQMALQVSTS